MLLAPACMQAPAPTPVVLESTPASSPTPATAPTSPATLEPLPAVPASALQPVTDPDILACFSEDGLAPEVKHYEIARVRSGADEFVYLEWAYELSPSRIFETMPSLLRLRGGVCEELIPTEWETDTIDMARWVPRGGVEHIDEALTAWRIAVAGGPEAYRRVHLQWVGPLVECAVEPPLSGSVDGVLVPSDEDCTASWMATRLRRGGVRVDPPPAAD